MTYERRLCVMDTSYSSPPDNIYSRIRTEIRDFITNYVYIVPGYSFNQYLTLKRINLYLNSRFENGGQYLNRDLIFFNIVNPPCEVATRMLNVDTKDIRLWPTNPKSYFSTWLLEKELKQWLKTNKMGKILNDIAVEAPQFGSVVLEKTVDGAKMQDLRRLFLDPTVEGIQDSRFVDTVHYMTPSELRATNWDNVEDAIQKFSSRNAPEPYEDQYGNLNVSRSTPYIKIVKRYGEVPSYWLDDKLVEGSVAGDKLVKSLFIVAGIDSYTSNEKGEVITEQGVTLFKGKWLKPWPYKDFHYSKVRGRWLGVGIVEALFDVQLRMNELKNSKRFSMELSTMHLFQTPDKSMVRNVLTDLQNGDLLYSPSGITPVKNEERNLPAWNDEEKSYSDQTDRLTFAYAAVRGEPMESSTPAALAQLQAQQSTSTFEFKRENLCLFLQGFFNDLVLPQLMKDLTPEHIMRFVGNAQELQKLDESAAQLHINDFVKQSVITGNAKNLNPQAIESVRQNAIQKFKTLGEARFLKIKQSFYDDVEFEFDFVIGDEQVDPAKLAANTQTVLQIGAQNPQIMQDPRLKLLFFKYAEFLGVSPAEMEFADTQATSQGMNQPIQMTQQPQLPQSPLTPAQPPGGSIPALTAQQ